MMVSLPPNTEIVHQGNKQDVSDYLGADLEDIDPPEGSYFYTITSEASVKAVAEAKARSAVRSDVGERPKFKSSQMFHKGQKSDEDVNTFSFIFGIEK